MNWKKIVLITAGFIFITSFLYGQGYEIIEQTEYSQIFRENGKIGVRDDSEIIIPAQEYDAIDWDAELQIYKCFEGKKFDVFDESGEEMFREYELIDIKIDLEHYLIQTADGTGIAEGSIVLVPPLYDNISIEPESYFPCCINFVVEKNGKKGVYADSRLMIPMEFDEMEMVNYDYIILSKNRKYGISKISEDSLTEILPILYDQISLLKDSEVFEVKKDKLIGILGMNYGDEYQFYIPPIYKEVSWSKKSEYDFGFVVPVKTSKEKGFVISSIEMDTSIFSTDVKIDSYENIIIKGSNGKYGVLDYKFSCIVPLEYDVIEENNSGLLEVKKDNKWGLMEDYKLLVEIKYENRDQLKTDGAYY